MFGIERKVRAYGCLHCNHLQFAVDFEPADVERYQEFEGAQPTIVERLDSFIRIPVETARLIAGHGIEGDDKAGRNPRRQINLLSYEWLAARREEGYKTGPGEFGEQLIIEGLAVEDLERGDRLQIGDEACIEITMARTGCIRLEAAQGVSSKLLRGNIGMLAKVVTGGTINVGNPVSLLERARSIRTVMSVKP